MALASVNIRFGVDMKEFSSKMQRATKKVKKFGKDMQKAGKTMTAAFSAPLALMGGRALQVFDQQVQAEMRLASALRATGQDAEAQMPKLKAFASEIQGMSTVGDEATLSMMAQATSMGLNADQAQTAAKQAIGLAAAFDMNEKSAIRYTAALADGETTMLNRYIPTLRSIEDDSARAAKAHEMLNGMFDQAKVAAQDGLGPLKQLNNSLGDLLESFGKIIADAIRPFVNWLKQVVKRFQETDQQTKRIITVVAALVAAIGPLLVVLGTLGAALPAIAAGFAAITGPVGLVIAAIAALAAGVLYLWDNWAAVKERISDISWWRNALVDMVQFLIEYSPISFLIKQVNNLIDFFGGDPIPNPFEGMANSLEGLKVETKEYEHEFGSFGDAVKNAAKKATDALLPLEKQAKKTGDQMNRLAGGGGSGGGRRRAVQIDAPDTRGLASMGPALPQGQVKDPVDTEAVEANPDPYRPWRESLQKFRPIVGSVQQGFQGFFNTLLQGGQNPFQAIIDSIKQLIVRLLAAAAAAAVLAAIMSAIGVGGAGASFGGGFSKIFGQMSGFNIGKSAAGGANMDASPRLVGEMGPEVFVPQGPGRIIPNNQLRGGGGVQKLHVTAGDMRLQGDALQSGIRVSGTKNKRWR